MLVLKYLKYWSNWSIGLIEEVESNYETKHHLDYGFIFENFESHKTRWNLPLGNSLINLGKKLGVQAPLKVI